MAMRKKKAVVPMLKILLVRFMSFFALVPILVPLPFMLLGLLVVLIQAVVFSTLAMVYISMAIEHEHDDH